MAIGVRYAAELLADEASFARRRNVPATKLTIGRKIWNAFREEQPYATYYDAEKMTFCGCAVILDDNEHMWRFS